MGEKIYIGTSGYAYAEWHKEGGFYHGRDVKRKEALNFYAKNFKFVEINSSFYCEPSIETLEKWKKSVPPKFKFSLKVHRYFTHMKRLNVDEDFIMKWGIFWQKCSQLKPKLGVMLFQLPVLRLKNSQIPLMIERLHRLQRILPKRQKIVFECRDPAWDCEAVKEVFKKYNWCFCIIHVNNQTGWAGELNTGFFPNPKVLATTAKWGVYIRLHGSEGKYVGSYNEEFLHDMAQSLNLNGLNKSIYIAFNNTNEHPTPAIKNAFEMQKLLSFGR
ncbi:MAG TPA: DUF72 domain-containing protein [Gammaproteobacteria bacterium]|nr:DUF72 domain-containing protein [Gammaproteobacteria bacterium]